MVNTVSPTYAREIMTPRYGERLDGLLRFRHFDVHGILNGLDYAVWDPSTDPQLADDLFGPARPIEDVENKRALQARIGAASATDVPLVSMVTRLDAQKGLDITGHVVHLLLNALAGEAQFVILGSGAPQFEGMFRQLAGYHTRNMAAILALRRGAGAPRLRGERHVPDAVAVRAVRTRPDDRDALRRRAGRASDRRVGRHGA